MLSGKVISTAIFMGVFFAFLVGGLSMIIDSVFNYDEQTLYLGMLFLLFAFIPFMIMEVKGEASREANSKAQRLYGERLEKILAWIEEQIDEVEDGE